MRDVCLLDLVVARLWSFGSLNPTRSTSQSHGAGACLPPARALRTKEAHTKGGGMARWLPSCSLGRDGGRTPAECALRSPCFAGQTIHIISRFPAPRAQIVCTAAVSGGAVGYTNPNLRIKTCLSLSNRVSLYPHVSLGSKSKTTNHPAAFRPVLSRTNPTVHPTQPPAQKMDGLRSFTRLRLCPRTGSGADASRTGCRKQKKIHQNKIYC